jgi:lipopolysaccharide heptosyltransferase I
VNILIVRLGSLGDIVHALPVAAALADRFSGARIDWLVDARYRIILDYVPVVSHRIVVSTSRHAASQDAGRGTRTRVFSGRRALPAAVAELRRGDYDVAFDLQGLLKSAALARLSGARRVIGFAPAHLREKAARWFYTETVDPTGTWHVVEKNLAALAAVGITGAPRRFPIDVPPSPIVEDVRRRLGLPADGSFVLINPAAGWPNKQWPPDRFGAAAAAMRVRHGLRSLVLWGPGEEPLASGVVERSAGAAMLAPSTTIADLVRLSRAARLMIAGDTGPLHIAAAMGTPIIGLFGPTDPQRNGPWDPADIALSRYDACVCHYQRRCRRTTACLADIAVEDLVAAIDCRLAVPFDST